MTDDELLRRIGRGDRAAFEALYDGNAPWLAVRLRRRCRDPELVAEVLQDTFVTVWRSAASYRGTGSAAGWLWTVAARKLVDALRSRAARAEVGAEITPEIASGIGSRPASTPQTGPSAEEVALAGELDGPLAAALDRLSPELRAVLQATVLDGLSTREAAVLLGLPEGTVKTRARRARLQLREALA